MLLVRQTETYAAWFAGLRDKRARARIDARIRRFALGNPGDVRPVGHGVSEIRIDYGPGYRVYFTQTGKEIVLLLCAGEASGAILRRRCRWRRRSEHGAEDVAVGRRRSSDR